MPLGLLGIAGGLSYSRHYAHVSQKAMDEEEN